MRQTYFLLIGLLFFSFYGCKQNSKQPPVISELPAETGPKLSKEEVLKQGNLIAMQTQKTLGSNLMKAVKEGGIINALDFCNLNAYPLVDSLEKKYQVSIRRATYKTRNLDDAPRGIEEEIVQYYSNLLAEGKTTDPIVKKLDDDAWLYSKPIVLDNTMCLKCHGAPGTDISEENYAHISKLYPNDKAIDYKVGDLRGIWSIKFSGNN